MQKKRGIREEDARVLYAREKLVQLGRDAFQKHRAEIEKMPEIKYQYVLSRCSPLVWEGYISALAHASITNSDTLSLMNEFNNLYVFPYREKND